jgi:hypothetical protein
MSVAFKRVEVEILALGFRLDAPSARLRTRGLVPQFVPCRSARKKNAMVSSR